MAARDELPDGLFEDVRNYCDITWEDEGTNRKLLTLIGNGIAYLDGKRGEPADYTADGLPRQLLLDYVRYGRDNALEVFENNYCSAILAMQHEVTVERYVLENS